MKRPSDDGGNPEGGGNPDDENSRAEEIAQRILRKYSKLFLYGGIALLVLIVIALVVASVSSK